MLIDYQLNNGEEFEPKYKYFRLWKHTKKLYLENDDYLVEASFNFLKDAFQNTYSNACHPCGLLTLQAKWI